VILKLLHGEMFCDGTLDI